MVTQVINFDKVNTMQLDDVKKDIDERFGDEYSDEFIAEMKQTCENMLNAKPLDGEFAKILNDNLWELY